MQGTPPMALPLHGQHTAPAFAALCSSWCAQQLHMAALQGLPVGPLWHSITSLCGSATGWGAVGCERAAPS